MLFTHMPECKHYYIARFTIAYTVASAITMKSTKVQTLAEFDASIGIFGLKTP